MGSLENGTETKILPALYYQFIGIVRIRKVEDCTFNDIGIHCVLVDHISVGVGDRYYDRTQISRKLKIEVTLRQIRLTDHGFYRLRLRPVSCVKDKVPDDGPGLLSFFLFFTFTFSFSPRFKTQG